MTQTRPSRSRASGAPSRAPRLSALHLVPDSLGFALDGAAQAVDAVDRGAALP
ncbi:16S rRNA (cytosine(967)-C(5))-methyltransferase RsmB, partial [Burkholderia pseudomallei]|nr:16S rRNA (cytosine(967)-C(5))-methyltransferase RsmB [Burkholderia pseudomallei]MBF3912645.1 16S rRNA (cytosine(967)-C(5))-methyltransferase RsmB [Burkholderia pseudomallei]